MSEKYTAHVVSHTHWDREWYKTFQHFRMRLVGLVDALLDTLESDPEFKYWHFDGQTIVLGDYLEIRPENEGRLRSLIASGRIQIGPWYNQPDEFLVSGESIIRNFMLGKKMCDDFGQYTSVGYVPDQFGHLSQLPQILLGFGIDNAIFFRGITTDQVDSEFVWRGADGSEVFAVKLPDNNAYSNWFYRCRETLRFPDKPVDADQVEAQVKGLIEDCLAERPSSSHLLFMDGCDHVYPQFKTPEIIRIANDRLPDVNIQHSTLPDFIAAVKTEDPKLDTVTGELRWANRKWKLQAILAHVMSSRIHLKQQNHACETLLEKYVEPLATFAWLLGDKYPSRYIEVAWKHLLKNSPHDSICGCSVDQVHKDMIYRFDQCRQIGEQLVKESVKSISDRIGCEPGSPEQRVILPVYNLLGHKRTDIVETEVDLPGSWEAKALRITDSEGDEISHAILGISDYHTMDPEPHDIPLGEHRRKVRVCFVGENIPEFGYRAYKVDVLATANRQPGSLLIASDTAENEYFVLNVSENGSLAVYDKETGVEHDNLLIYEDAGDLGDGWNYVKPATDRIITSLGAKARVCVWEDNSVRATFRIDSELDLPIAAATGRQTRSEETILCPIVTYVTLTRGVRRIDIRTEFDNRAKDHRLRVLFTTGITSEVSAAESTFDVVERPIAQFDCRDWIEPMPVTHPQKSFVSISGESHSSHECEDMDCNEKTSHGFTVINRGLPEYEVIDNNSGTIALTLMRAFGQGVRAGEGQQVEGQDQGPHTFEFAFVAHKGDWQTSGAWQSAHSFNTPLIAGQTGVHAGELPFQLSFVEVFAENFYTTAVKKADKQEAVIVRGCNIGREMEPVKAKVLHCEKSVWVAINEEPDSEITQGIAAARQIVTQSFSKILG